MTLMAQICTDVQERRGREDSEERHNIRAYPKTYRLIYTGIAGRVSGRLAGHPYDGTTHIL